MSKSKFLNLKSLILVLLNVFNTSLLSVLLNLDSNTLISKSTIFLAILSSIFINNDNIFDEFSYKYFFVTLQKHRDNKLNQIGI